MFLSGLEKLGPSQLEPERVLHQVAQGPRPTRQRSLLDHRPGLRVHVWGRIIPEKAERFPEKGPQELRSSRSELLTRDWLGLLTLEMFIHLVCLLTFVQKRGRFVSVEKFRQMQLSLKKINEYSYNYHHQQLLSKKCTLVTHLTNWIIFK